MSYEKFQRANFESGFTTKCGVSIEEIEKVVAFARNVFEKSQDAAVKENIQRFLGLIENGAQLESDDRTLFDRILFKIIYS